MNCYCTFCNSTYCFDGRSFGILNFSDNHLFAVELVLELLEFKVNGGTATNGYWQSKVDSLLRYRPSDSATKLLRKRWMNMSGKVNSVVTEFLKILVYPQSFFKCCESPKIVCVDGIVLSVENRRIEKQCLTEPWRDTTVSNQRFSKRRDRNVLAMDKDDYIIIRSFVHTGIVFTKFVGIEREELVRLNTKMRGSPVLVFLICAGVLTGDLIRCPALLCEFVQCLYKEVSPASSLAPAPIWATLKSICEKKTIQSSYMDTIARHAPVLNGVLNYAVSLEVNSHPYRSCLLLLAHLLGKAYACYSTPTTPGYLTLSNLVILTTLLYYQKLKG